VVSVTDPYGRILGFLVVGNAGRKRPLGRPRRRWADNIRMDNL
jgi:hypothetical protein